MAWIESHQSLANHPKIFKLSSLTGYETDKCLAKMHRLWWWALTYAEDGDLKRFDFKEIGLGVGIEDAGEAKKFVQAIIDSGFIDKNEMKIHDWLDYAGRYLHSKYHSSNPLKWKRILKKYAGKPKGRLKATFRTDIPNQPNQPNLPTDTRRTVKDPPAPSAGGKQLFDQFWAAYPKHKARAEAVKAFLKIHPDEQLLARMLSSIERAKTSDDWKRQNGRYVPYPATWLNGRRWEDEFDGSDNGGGKKGKYSGIGVTVETEG